MNSNDIKETKRFIVSHCSVIVCLCISWCHY